MVAIGNIEQSIQFVNLSISLSKFIWNPVKWNVSRKQLRVFRHELLSIHTKFHRRCFSGSYVHFWFLVKINTFDLTTAEVCKFSKKYFLLKVSKNSLEHTYIIPFLVKLQTNGNVFRVTPPIPPYWKHAFIEGIFLWILGHASDQILIKHPWTLLSNLCWLLPCH